MNMKVCAASDRASRWEDINFKAAVQSVKKLQKRIAVAACNDEMDVVAYLQHRLIHSFYAKALAVKIVTSNKGKRTPGIDNIVWSTPQEKFQAIHSLTRRGYHPKPLKRIWIPKSNGSKRPLSIPTMKDRAMQTLYKFTLEPVAEATGDPHSYGFRANRSARDAVRRCIEVLSQNSYAEWIFKADIEDCFDNISHKWMMEHIPLDKEILHKFLECGFISRSSYYPTTRGIPQGGSISSVICNMVLDGLEQFIEGKGNTHVWMVRYADDILIVADTPTFWLQCGIPDVNDFLSERGLKLSPKKTQITNVKNGFVFLGFQIQKENGHILAVPSKKSVMSLLDKIRNTLSPLSVMALDDLSYQEIGKLANSLKQIIRGWLNYVDGIVTPESLCDVKYEAANLAEKLTEDDRFAGFINKIFDR